IDPAVAHSGSRSIRCSADALGETHGARQVIDFDPPIQHPFRVAGWSRAVDAEVGRDYDVYLDLHYDDGTPLWGRIAAFKPGTHDWQPTELVFDVARPVKRIELFVLFRNAKGTVWFDDIEVTLAPFDLREARVVHGLFGPGSVGIAASASLPASWRVALEAGGRVVAQQSGDALPIRALFAPGPLAEGAAPRFIIEARDTYLGEAQTQVVGLDPAPSAAGPERPYAVWTETAMRRVMPQALPPSAEALAAPEARIALAGHEYESFQVALCAASDASIGDVHVELSDLACEANGAQIPRECIEWHQVGYVAVKDINQHPANPALTSGWYPDALLPVESFGLSPDLTQALWVTVYAPLGTPPGEYAGTLTLRPAGAPPAEVAVRATVYGFSLPETGHLKTAFALMDGYLERVYGKPLSPEIRRRYGDYVLRHRLNPDDISRTAPPVIDDLLHYRDRGLNAFNVLNMVEERGDRPWVCFSDKETYTTAFKERLIARLDPYVAALRDAGLAGKAYIYTFDERGDDFFPIIREYFGMVKERYPEIPTFTTAKIPQDPAAMRDLNVDWNCPLTSVYDFEAAERCRATGLEVWAYVCCGPRYPYANWMLEHPLIESRVLWWQCYHQKMDGLLYWGLSIWSRPHNDRPIDPAAGPLLDWELSGGGTGWWARVYGDGRLLYAGPDGPFGSIRLANIRDGLEDYEYLWLLSEAAGDVETGRAACPPVTTSLTDFTRDPAVVYAQRDKVARLIAEKVTDK
ncbi:MAG: DUF4091 domain-containing protein, partial [Candidatus Hydrogenedentes bacterium]|nr:DUF4091 domain-containing protein [Candidatus Hydrogenedentota bacterium]